MYALAFLLPALLTTEPLGPGDSTRTLEVGGRTRSYIVHIPPKYDPKQPTPVVLAYHGGGSNAKQMVRFCGLSEKADKEGFIVVYPNGTGRLERMLTWNGGNCCAYAMWNNVDDVGFTRALLDDVAKVASVDPSGSLLRGSPTAVSCATGWHRNSLIGSLPSPRFLERWGRQHAVRSVPCRYSTSTARTIFLPFQGGRGTRSLTQTEFYSVEHSIRAWVKANGCPELPVVKDIPDTAHDGTTVQQKTYGPGKDDSEVILVAINGGGHAWPGHGPGVRFLGKTTKNVSANDLMWEFFKRHPMK